MTKIENIILDMQRSTTFMRSDILIARKRHVERMKGLTSSIEEQMKGCRPTMIGQRLKEKHIDKNRNHGCADYEKCLSFACYFEGTSSPERFDGHKKYLDFKKKKNPTTGEMKTRYVPTIKSWTCKKCPKFDKLDK